MELRNANENKEPEKQKPENIHKNHRSRLKSQYLKNGIDALTDIQKLELLLFYAIPQKDTNPLAHELLRKFGDLKGVLSASYNELLHVKGIKENSATLISLINDLLNITYKEAESIKILSSSAAKNYASRLFFNVPVEQFYVICLAKSNRIVSTKLISSGTIDEVNVQIRHITQTAIDNKCNSIIVCHNHPRGLGQVSDEDFSFTYSLICSCLLNNIDVVDHVVVGTDKAVSFFEQKLMAKLKEKAASTVKLSADRLELISSLTVPYTDDSKK